MPFEDKRPMTFLLWGEVAAGKSTFVRELCAELGLPLWALSGKASQDAEDASCRPARLPKPGGEVEYTASQILAAAHLGGAVFFDEIDKASDAALNVLLKLLDDDRRMEADSAGVSFVAHPDFRFCAACNNPDLLPEAIRDRMDIELHVPPLTQEEITGMLRAQNAGAGEMLFAAFDAEVSRAVPARRAAAAFEFAWRLWTNDGKPALTLAGARAYIRRACEAARISAPPEAS